MEEKMRILKMVEEGKISAEQAVGLMEALDDNGAELTDGARAGESRDALEDGAVSYEDKMLRVIVDSAEGDKVNVQFPVKIIRQVLKVAGKLPLISEELQGIDLDALAASILECLDNETLGNIVEVDAADGSKVKVFIG